MPLLPFFCKDFEDGGVWLGAIMTAQAGVSILYPFFFLTNVAPPNKKSVIHALYILYRVL
jgi:hypothetical protein